MAKYTVKMSCGHEDTVELFGKNTERKRRISYYEIYGLCKECYKKEMEEKAKAEGLVFNATAFPYVDDKNGNILLNVWFSGDTRPHKDDIKALGYYWRERIATEDEIEGERRLLCWNKIINADDLDKEVEKAKSIGAIKVLSKEDLLAIEHYNYRIALHEQKKWKEQQRKIAEIPKPYRPEILGNRWNMKIYGKSGNYSIYPDGEKVMITDEQAKEIENYLKDKEEYSKKVTEIKSTK